MKKARFTETQIIGINHKLSASRAQDDHIVRRKSVIEQKGYDALPSIPPLVLFYLFRRCNVPEQALAKLNRHHQPCSNPPP
jgi:hypothetical protein